MKLENIIWLLLLLAVLGLTWEHSEWVKEDTKYHDSLIDALIQCQGTKIEQDTMYQDYLLDVKEGEQE